MSDWSKSYRRGVSPQLLNQVEGLVKGTLDFARSALVQGSQVGKTQLDLGLLRRKRNKVMATIGEEIFSLIEQGVLAESNLPELQQHISQAREIERQIKSERTKFEGTQPAFGQEEDLYARWQPQDDDSLSHFDSELMNDKIFDGQASPLDTSESKS